jgi:iron complex outermembrane receptor protein
MQVNAATFYYDYEDKQVLSVVNDEVFGPLAVLVNVPESEIFGAELEGSWLATERLTINFGLSYLDTEITDYSGFHPLRPELGSDVDFKGAELGSSPEWTTNLRATYEWDISGNLFARVTADASYKDAYFSGIEYVNPTDDRFQTEDYTLANARATIGSQDGAWDVSAWVRNIGDEYYYHSVSFSNDAITRGLGRGRTWGLSLSYRWM